MTPTRDELLTDAQAEHFWETRVGTAPPEHIGEFAREYAALLCAHQAQAEPKEWADQEDPQCHGGGKACVDCLCRGECIVAPPSSDQTWNEAIEAAVRVCEGQIDVSGKIEPFKIMNVESKLCADAIRKLARPSPVQEPIKPASGAAPSSDPIAWHSKQYGTCWMHLQPYHLERGTQFFVRGRTEPVATITSKGGAILWHIATSEFEHGTFFYPCATPEVQPVSGAVDEREHGTLAMAWLWRMHGWAVTAHGKHRAVKTFVDTSRPPTCTTESPDFIELIPLSRAQQAPAVSDEVQRVLNRLDSSDPDFDDCAAAAALIIRMDSEIKGPGGFSTWKDAAVASRVALTNFRNAIVRSEELRSLFIEALDFGIGFGPRLSETGHWKETRVDKAEALHSKALQAFGLHPMQQSPAAAPVSEQTKEWINVDDRLPEPETDVMVRVVRGNLMTLDIAGLFHDEWASKITERNVNGAVTHWMPLPTQPPKEQSQ